jgi:hypothetical protein
VSKPASNPRQPRGPRPIRSLPLAACRDYTDDELSELMDTEAERAYAALHGGCVVCGNVRGVRCCEFGADR